MTTTGTAVTPQENLTWVMRSLVFIEKAGNKLPHPFWLFLSLAAFVMVLSSILSAAGVSAVNPASGETVVAVNLFAPENLGALVGGVVTNFVTFPALGLVLVVLFGVAVAEQSGLIPTLLRSALINVKPRWVTLVVGFVGAAASIASDASYLIVIPLGGLAFKAVGRSPVIGCAVAYASVAGGYSAAPFVSSMDAVLGGISTSAANIIDDSYAVTPVANMYFNFVSMFVVAGAVTLVTELLLSKREKELAEDPVTEQTDPAAASAEHDLAAPVTKVEIRGMIVAGITIVVCAVTLWALTLPENSFLRDAEGTLGPESPLMVGISPIIGFGFFVVGIVYGVVTKSIRTASDVPAMMVKGLAPFVPVLVLFFAASQFLAVFTMSELGEIMAIRGAEFFGEVNAPAIVILFGAYLLTALGAIFITSGSGLWTLMAPVLVPMLMLLGISPEATQAVYRIGDSTMNPISPMSPYFVMVLGFIQRYKKDAGMGTLLSMTVPLAFTMYVLWGLLFFAWWALGIPLGPGTPMTYAP